MMKKVLTFSVGLIMTYSRLKICKKFMKLHKIDIGNINIKNSWNPIWINMWFSRFFSANTNIFKFYVISRILAQYSGLWRNSMKFWFVIVFANVHDSMHTLRWIMSKCSKILHLWKDNSVFTFGEPIISVCNVILIIFDLMRDKSAFWKDLWLGKFRESLPTIRLST